MRVGLGVVAAVGLALAAGPVRAELLHCVIPGGERKSGTTEMWMVDANFYFRTESLVSTNWRDWGFRGLAPVFLIGQGATARQDNKTIVIERVIPIHDPAMGYAPDGPLNTLRIALGTGAAVYSQTWNRGPDPAVLRFEGSCLPAAIL